MGFPVGSAAELEFVLCRYPAVRRSRADCSLVDSRGHGLLIAHSDPEGLGWLLAELASLGAEMTTAASGDDVWAHLSTASAPEVAVLAHDLGGMDADELCRRLRADGRHAGTYVVIVGGTDKTASEATFGRGPDAHVADPVSPVLLRATVRAGLRAQASRRFHSRRERRRAIAWLAGVIAHEVNNPLAVAVSCAEQAADLLAAKQPDAADWAELSELNAEIRAALGRIRDATYRLEWHGRLHLGAADPVSMPQLVERLRERVGRSGRAVEVRAEKRSATVGSFDIEALVEATAILADAAFARCSGGAELTVHLDATRVAIALDVEGAPDEDPEAILEPRLASRDGGTPHFEPGLCELEACFEELGGQIFVLPAAGRWRFGIMLPMGVATVEL